MSTQDQTTVDQGTGVDERMATHEIVDTIAAEGEFNSLISALRASGLASVLQGPGLYTLFAPTDDAFSQIQGSIATDQDQGKLTALLSRHILTGALRTEDLRTVSEVKTRDGQTLPVEIKDGQIRVGGATLIRRDHACTNGIVHVIDKVLA